MITLSPVTPIAILILDLWQQLKKKTKIKFLRHLRQIIRFRTNLSFLFHFAIVFVNKNLHTIFHISPSKTSGVDAAKDIL
jgi:hypothetical protein